MSGALARPAPIWISFAVCLTLGVGAMTWLTKKACELDRAEAAASAQARTEEAIGRALWRIDTLLAPILAEEAARPTFVYQPALDDGATTKSNGKIAAPGPTPTPSPLLTRPSEFAVLNFQMSDDDRLTSPQCVEPARIDWAVRAGVSKETLAERSRRLAELGRDLQFAPLLAMLPSETLPPELPPESLSDSPGFKPPSDDRSQVSQTPGRPAPRAQYARQEDTYVANKSLEIAQARQQFDSQSPLLPPQSAVQQQQATPLGEPSNADDRNRDLQSRNESLQQFVRRERAEQNQMLMPPIESGASPRLAVREGVSRPLWIGSRLILARRIVHEQQTWIQGCWLDWPKLKSLLLDEVADLLPQLQLEPLSESGAAPLGRLLATLPVQAVVPPMAPAPIAWSPIRVSLAAAWGALLIAAAAVAALLHGVLTLSERRGAFVAAVTHELRTPLTTFRMYAEMLSQGMVPAGERQQLYLETLRVEADRLSHLVENVLQYARLERGRPGRRRRESTTVDDLLQRVETRLAERAEQAEMRLLVELDAATRQTTLQTDPAAVEQILFNLVDNACKYAAAAADRRIHLEVARRGRELVLRVRDHGPGISQHGARKLFRPFSKSVHEAASTAPGVGLGLALSRRLANELGGDLRFGATDANTTGAAFELSLPTA